VDWKSNWLGNRVEDYGPAALASEIRRRHYYFQYQLYTAALDRYLHLRLPGYRYEFWYGMLAPAKTPRVIVEKLNREITDIMKSEDVRNRWIALGVEPVPTTPQEFDKFIRDDIATVTKLARAANIKAD